MTTHAKLSPSSAHRWGRCPGAPREEAAWPDSTSEYAEKGTAEHEAAAYCLANGCDAEAIVGQIYNGWAIEADQVEAIQQYLDYVRGLPGVHRYESAVPIGDITGNATDTGTADALAIADGELVVADYKSGRGVRVDADDNWQLRMYAYGALVEWDHLFDIDQVRMVIVQPRLGHVSEETLDADALRFWARDMADKAAAARDPEAPLVPGPVQCRWCRAKAGCPALAESIANRPALEAPAQAPGDLAERLALVPLVRDWANAVEALAKEHLVSGRPLPGYKLIRGRAGARRWADESAAEQALRGLRAKVRDIYPKKLISPAQAEKLVGRAKLANMADLIRQEPGKPTVAAESDPHPAIDPAEELGFPTASDEPETEVSENVA